MEERIFGQIIAKSPIGAIKITASHLGIKSVELLHSGVCTLNPSPFTQQCAQQLLEYLHHERISFDIPLDLEEATVFQKKVWLALQDIPYGKTTNYEALSHSLDNPLAIRAVASANAKNPIAIIIPCHRVIGKNGQARGYAYGIPLKLKLLNMELKTTQIDLFS